VESAYYLSTYIHIDKLAHLLDLSIRHDQNISLWKKTGDNIELIHYWELERITGQKKHHRSFFEVDHAKEVVNELLSQYGLTLMDIKEIWGTPELGGSVDDYALNDYPDLPFHNLSHLFSSILIDTDIFHNNNIIGLAVDGGPDWTIGSNHSKSNFYSGCVVRNNTIEAVFPVKSPGLIWDFASKHYNMQEGSLMALATASTSRIDIPTENVLEISGFENIQKAYDFFHSIVNRVDELTEAKDFNGFDKNFTDEENKISIVMKNVQAMSNRIMESNIDSILEKYNIRPETSYLAMSGGYALNCPGNSLLMQKYRFKGFLAPPCVSDSGMSLGIALYMFYKKGKSFNFKFKSAYYGNEDKSTQEVLHNQVYARYIKNYSSLNIEQVVDDITKSPIVWFSGASEIGPRALGNRSLLADPRNERSKQLINKYKQREWWRPVAPIILDDKLSEWFEDSYESPYMLHAYRIRKAKGALVPAAIHLDNTARVQTISGDKSDHVLFQLLNAFYEDTGIPILCNTSLNDNGEPIIDSINEAINFSLRKGIKVIYINSIRIELHNHDLYPINKPHSRKVNVNYFTEVEQARFIEELNPYNLSKEEVFIYYRSPSFRSNLSLTSDSDVRIIRKLASTIGSYNMFD
jgi:carbamoyltransferase